MSLRPPQIEEIRAEIRGEACRPAKRQKSQAPNPEDARRLFTVCTGNRWMELGNREPPAKMLFGGFWYQHEICFLFAGTNTGKSILAVQIANAISRGSKIGPFLCQVQPARVLYADFELSTLQFHRRYNNLQTDYNFNDNFFRAQFNPAAENPDPEQIENFFNDDYLIAGLEYRIRQLKATVLIIDNISCLSGGTRNPQPGKPPFC